MRSYSIALLTTLAATLTSSKAGADYMAEVLAHNPIAYWRFEDGDSSSGATAANSSFSGFTYSGTYGPGVTLMSGPSLPGLNGLAASFDGVTGEISVPVGGFPVGDSARTFVAWFRTSQKPSTGQYPNLFSYGTMGYNKVFAAGLNSDHDVNGPPGVSGELYATQYGNATTTLRPINDGIWHFLAVTVDPSDTGATPGNPRWSVYLDGEVESSKVLMTNTVLTGNGGKLGFPCMDSNPDGTRWQGEIDEVAMFGRVLTAGEIQGLYDAANVPEPPVVVLLAVAIACLALRSSGPLCSGDSTKLPFLVAALVFAGGPAQAEVIAHFAFDGNLQDSAGNLPVATTGTGQQAISFDLTDKMFGSAAARFDNDLAGSNGQWVAVADNALFHPGGQGLNNLTITMWIRPDGWGQHNHNRRLLQKGGDYDWQLTRCANLSNENGELHWIQNQNQAITASPTETYFTVGQWHHVAAVFDGDRDSMVIYGDGSSIATSAISADAVCDPNTSTLWLGTKGAGNVISDHYDGWMDEVWIFSDALTQSQVQMLMTTNTNPVPEPSSLSLIGALAIGLLAWRLQMRRKPIALAESNPREAAAGKPD